MLARQELRGEAVSVVSECGPEVRRLPVNRWRQRSPRGNTDPVDREPFRSLRTAMCAPLSYPISQQRETSDVLVKIKEKQFQTYSRPFHRASAAFLAMAASSWARELGCPCLPAKQLIRLPREVLGQRLARCCRLWRTMPVSHVQQGLGPLAGVFGEGWAAGHGMGFRVSCHEGGTGFSAMSRTGIFKLTHYPLLRSWVGLPYRLERKPRSRTPLLIGVQVGIKNTSVLMRTRTVSPGTMFGIIR